MTQEPPIESTVPVSSEAQQVLDLLRDFQKEINLMHSKLEELDTRVNKEMPSQIDAALNELKQNDMGLVSALQKINARLGGQTSSTVEKAAEQNQPQGAGGMVQQIINTIFKRIEGGGGTVSGGLSEFDKEILKTSKQIQLVTLKDTLKRVYQGAGLTPPVEHMVLNE
jgi:DNA repair exonuclease SbcCD ATPase subunit